MELRGKRECIAYAHPCIAYAREPCVYFMFMCVIRLIFRSRWHCEEIFLNNGLFSCPNSSLNLSLTGLNLYQVWLRRIRRVMNIDRRKRSIVRRIWVNGSVVTIHNVTMYKFAKLKNLAALCSKKWPMFVELTVYLICALCYIYYRY